MADLNSVKEASQLTDGQLLPSTLRSPVYAALQLDRGLMAFETTLNSTLCPLLKCSEKEAVEWCAMLLNEPRDKAIRTQAVNLKAMTKQQVNEAIQAAGGPHGSFVDAALQLGYLDQTKLEAIRTKLGEGAHPELKNKYPAYKNWDIAATRPLLKAVPKARNLLNHTPASLPVRTVEDALDAMRQILEHMSIDGTGLKVSNALRCIETGCK